MNWWTTFDAGSTTIIIGFTYKDNGLTLIVQDNGIGIPELDEEGQPADNIQLVLHYGEKMYVATVPLQIQPVCPDGNLSSAPRLLKVEAALGVFH